MPSRVDIPTVCRLMGERAKRGARGVLTFRLVVEGCKQSVGRTDSGGWFILHGVQAGHHYLYAVSDPPGHAAEWLIPVSMGNASARVDLPSGQPVESPGTAPNSMDETGASHPISSQTKAPFPFAPSLSPP